MSILQTIKENNVNALLEAAAQEVEAAIEATDTDVMSEQALGVLSHQMTLKLDINFMQSFLKARKLAGKYLVTNIMFDLAEVNGVQTFTKHWPHFNSESEQVLFMRSYLMCCRDLAFNVADTGLTDCLYPMPLIKQPMDHAIMFSEKEDIFNFTTEVYYPQHMVFELTADDLLEGNNDVHRAILDKLENYLPITLVVK